MNDLLVRQNQEANDVIVLDENSDGFNQKVQEIILDTDEKSASPCPVKVHPSLTKVLKKHQTEGIQFLYKCLIGSIGNLGKKATVPHTGAVLGVFFFNL